MTWAIVHFLEDNTVEVVPQSWLVEFDSLNIECFWPKNYSRKKAYEAVLKKDSPDSTWKVYGINILGKYDDFRVAQAKVNRAKENDRLTTSDDEESQVLLGRGFRTKKKTEKCYDSSYEEDSDETQYPNVPKCLEKKGEIITEKVTLSEKSHTGISSKNSSILEDPDETNIEKCINKKGENISKKVNKEKNNTTGVSSKGDGNINRKEVLMSEKGADLVAAAENKEFQRQVMRQLYIINSRIRELQENFQVLMHKESQIIAPDVEDTTYQPIMDLFPISSETNLQKLEDFLKETAEMNIMVKQLSLIGGASVKEATKRIMYRIINNEMGSKFSWEGQKGKRKFRDLKTAALVMKAVRIHFKEATETEIISCIKEWLVRAKFRGGVKV